MAVLVSDKLYRLLCDVMLTTVSMGQDDGGAVDIDKYRRDATLAVTALVLQWERDNQGKRAEIRDMLDKYIDTKAS